MKNLITFLLIIFAILGHSEEPIQEEFLDAGKHVNVLTGNLSFEEVDLIVPGIEPIVIKRRYLSTKGGSQKGGWSFVEHGIIHYYPEHKVDKNPIRVTEPNGSSVIYDWKYNEEGAAGQKKFKHFVFLPRIQNATLGFTNHSQREIGGRTNTCNYRVKTRIDNDKYIHLITGDGTKRIYKQIAGSYRLEREEKPNGNKFFYKWDGYRLKRIHTTNPSESKTYAWAEFYYPELDEEDFYVKTSNGRKIHYFYSKQKIPQGVVKPSIYHYHLEKVSDETDTIEENTYQKAPEEKNQLILKKRKILGKDTCEIEYYKHRNNYLPNGESYFVPSRKDGRIGRVRTIKQPVGQNGELIPTHMFRYFSGEKITEDGLENPGYNEIEETHGLQTTYRYTKHLRVNEVQTFDKTTKAPRLLTTQKFLLDDIGTLQASASLDAKNNTLSLRHLAYDENWNVKCETLYANLTGQGKGIFQDNFTSPGSDCYKKTYDYSKDGLNLLLTQEEDSGLGYRFRYHPNTNLITAKFTLEKGQIRKREFFEYNTDHILIQSVVDDGSSDDPQNLQDVTVRVITNYQLKKENPALNFPEMIEEKYWDKKTNSEKLLKKTFLEYSQNCKVLKKHVYDADKAFRYTLAFSYDNHGNLLEETTPHGDKFLYTYNIQGQKTSERKEGSLLEKLFHYDEAGRPYLEEEKLSGAVVKSTSHFFDTKGRCIRTICPNGKVIQYTYDVLGNCLRKETTPMQDSNGTIYTPAIDTTYDPMGNPLTITNANGEALTLEHNLYGKPTLIKKPDGSSLRNIYNPNGTLKTTSLEDRSRLEYTYDYQGRMLTKALYSTDGAYVSSEKWTYNAFDLLSHLDAKEVLTTYAYDGAGRKISEIKSDGNTTQTITYAYDPLGHLFSTATDLGSKRVSVHDNAGKIIEEKEYDAAGVLVSSILYNHYSNKKEIIRSGRKKEQIFYDDYNRPVKIIDPLGNQTLVFYYEPEGVLYTKKTTIDPLGLKTTETFDAEGRLTSIEKINPLDQVLCKTEFLYDRTNRKVKEIHNVYIQKKLHHTYEIAYKYDANGKVIAQTENNEKTIQYGYDAKGRLTLIINPDGSHINYAFNPEDQITEIRSSDVHYIFSYQDHGKIIQITDLLTGETFQRTQDGFGNILSETQNHLTIHKSYDSLGRKTHLTLPDSSVIQYHYDSNFLRKVDRNAPDGALLYSHKYTQYSHEGVPKEEELPFDLGTLTRSTNDLGKTNEISSPHLTHQITQFDPLGNPLSAKHSLFGPNVFSYDSLYQLSNENAAAYEYDSLGNLLQNEDTDFELNHLNQIESADGAIYTYNRNGCPIKKLTQDTLLEYSYDALGRLLSITEPEHISLHFAYDPWNRRTKKTTYLYQDNTWQKYAELTFLYDENKEIAALTNGSIVELRILGQGRAPAIAFELDSKPYIPLHDLFGNVSALLSPETGQIAEAYHYTAFGEITIHDSCLQVLPQSALNTPWLYSSKRFDPETNLTYFGARYYDPALARFLTPDPLGFADGPNLYAYVHNNPLSNFDPTGLFSIGGMDVNFTIEVNSPNYQINVIPIVAGVLNCTGTALLFFNKHCFAKIPVLTDCIDILGRTLQLNFQLAEVAYDTISGFIAGTQGKYRLIYANGIMNETEDECKESARQLSNRFGVQVDYIHTLSKGFVNDLLDSIFCLCGYETEGAANFRSHLANILDKAPSASFLLIAHSRATIYTHLALKKFNGNYSDRLQVIAIGPAKVLDPDLGYRARNLVSLSDAVPLIGDFFKILGHRIFKNHPEITQVRGNGHVPLIDHGAANYFDLGEFKYIIQKFLDSGSL